MIILLGFHTISLPAERKLNYRLRVTYNKNNLVPTNIMIADPIAEEQYDYSFEKNKVKFVHLNRNVSSIALWNPVASIISPHQSDPFRQRRRHCQMA